MCYASEAYCNFTCGHNFCHQCTKNWFQKGQSTCPMCRASMCFKGITKMKKKWHREKQEETYKNLVTHIFDELMEEYGDILVQILEVVQNQLKCVGLVTVEQMVIFVLKVVWVVDHTAQQEMHCIVVS